MRADDIAFGIGCIVIHSHEVLLVFDRTHSGADDERLMELGLMSAGKVCEEVGCPLTAIASFFWQTGIDHQSGGLRHADKRTAGNSILQVDVVFNALKRLEFNALVLAYERIVGSAKCVATVNAGHIQRGDLAHGDRNCLFHGRRGERIASGGHGPRFRRGCGCGRGRWPRIGDRSTGCEVRLGSGMFDGYSGQRYEASP